VVVDGVAIVGEEHPHCRKIACLGILGVGVIKEFLWFGGPREGGT
jgi:hypothetical protein